METYTLTAIGLSQQFIGNLADAIELAKQLDAEYQRWGGVTISNESGEVLLTIEDSIED